MRLSSPIGLTGASAVVVLLAAITLSSSAEAETFTLQELFDGESFQIGQTVFRNWVQIDPLQSDVDPSNVTVETIENSTVVGFTVNGGSELSGTEDLEYDFDLIQLDTNVITTGTLFLYDVDVFTEMFEISITLNDCDLPAATGDCNDPGERLSLLVNLEDDQIVPNLIDAERIDPPLESQTEFRFRTEFEQNQLGEGGLATRRYATFFTVVPEPGTALLLGLGLSGLHVLARSRRT